MSTRDLIARELEALPPPLLDEVLDFVRFLKERGACGDLSAALVSEAVLAKDWLRPEEDEAWKDL